MQNRYPSTYVNDAESGYSILTTCSGRNQVGACDVSISSENGVQYSQGIDISEIGRVRVCYMYAYGSEYMEIGQIGILPPRVDAVYPVDGVLMNKPFVLHIDGLALQSTDLVKVVQNAHCNGPISSRPYFNSLTVTNHPANTQARVVMTLTGPGDWTPGLRKVCYSYDGGYTYVDTGFTIRVVSPRAYTAMPTQLSLAATRKVSLYGDAMMPGDRVKMVKKGATCYGVDDVQDTVLGGEGRPLNVSVALPERIGVDPWPVPASQGFAEFMLPRDDPAVRDSLCVCL
jgi:hypothetical protein